VVNVVPPSASGRDQRQADAYADHFIAVHIQNISGDKAYFQLFTESLAQHEK
jgi:hypothetical protein